MFMLPKKFTIACNGCHIMDGRHNVIYTWDAMVRHVIDVQNFEVLSSFKFDSSMGRVVPEFVVWGAMGVAAMGASKAGKKIDDNEFFFRKTAQVMNEEKPRMQLTKQGFVNAAHDAWVELADVCRVCARAGAKKSAHKNATKMYQRSNILHRACKKTKLEL